MDKDLADQVAGIAARVVAMHTAMYAGNPDVGCVLHTHSPYATAYAVARRPIGCWIEALAMFGLQDGVPVAGYGPCGSAEAVAHIRAAVTPGVPAGLGGPVEIPPDLRAAALQRAMTSGLQGTVSA